MRLPLSWRIQRISFKHWLWHQWIALKYRALDATGGWSGGVRYLYDASPALIATQGLAAAALISGSLVLLSWLAPVIHALAWAYAFTLLALATAKALTNHRDR